MYKTVLQFFGKLSFLFVVLLLFMSFSWNTFSLSNTSAKSPSVTTTPKPATPKTTTTKTATTKNKAAKTTPQIEIKVYLNGVKLEFDAKPYTKGGRTMLPFAKIFQAFGMKVQWNASAGTVTAKNEVTEIYFKVGDKTAYVNKYMVAMDVPAEVRNNRTFVPLKFISDNLGAKITWDGVNQKVNIAYADKKYAVGQEGSFGDMKFSIDKVETITESNCIRITGKVNLNDKKLMITLYDASGNDLPAIVSVSEQSGTMYSYTASAYLSSSTNLVIKRMVIQMLDEKKNYIKMAEYSM